MLRSIRAFGHAAVFVLKLFPMIPSRAVDWITTAPRVDKVKYPRHDGEAEADLYRPARGGPFPGIVVCLGVVPFGVEHPQVPVLGRALARAGFAALLYWSPHMRDFRLHADDIGDLARAYRWLVERKDVDARRSGLLGTCVGGAFAFMAASREEIRDQVGFIGVYAPFGSMTTFAHDIASSTREVGGRRQPWKVDQLTRRVFVHSLTANLAPDEAERLREAYVLSAEAPEVQGLSPEAQIVQAVLRARSEAEADEALGRMPTELRERLEELSPMRYAKDVRAPTIAMLHDEGDLVIPISESRRLRKALGDRPGLHYTVMHFSHLDPSKGRLPLPMLVREFGNFFGGILPLFRQSA